MIGIIDSGVGGLSVFLELKKLDQNSPVVYLSDSANFPYGDKELVELDYIVDVATKKLLEFGVTDIVLACNSATVSTIDKLRSKYPKINFVGVEPAIKLAADATKNGKIGLLATRRTVISHGSEELASGKQIFKHHDAEIISKIENNVASITDADLHRALMPLLVHDPDTIVLGCTHFYFIKSDFQKMFPSINFIEPAIFVAKNVLQNAHESGVGGDVFLTSGNLGSFSDFLADIIGVKDADIRQV